MKKTIYLFLILLLIIGIVGCSNTGAPTQNNTNETIENKEQTEIVLTPENIYEYLTISKDITDVEKEYLGADCSVAEGKLTVKTAPRKRGDFSDVTIQVTLHTTSGGWEADGKWEMREKTFIIPFDGNFEEIFKIRSNVTEKYITTTPSFEIIINSVSGKFIEQ
ncbi:MAG: hypothetical protein J6A78_05120 [Clostridia bacterium]|nr:hypothetical protein [Clostridia bacterium]